MIYYLYDCIIYNAEESRLIGEPEKHKTSETKGLTCWKRCMQTTLIAEVIIGSINISTLS